MGHKNSFFKKYIPEWQQIQAIVHEHVFVILGKLILWMSFWVFIPVFLYYHSFAIQWAIPFYILEILLIFVFIKVIYDIFNWYNDAWIITDDGIYDLEWSLLKTNLESVRYDSIEGIEIDKHRIWDTIFNKWDILIHKFGEETLVIENAFSPYKAVDQIEPFLFPKPEEKEDRFELLMHTLGDVVEDYLDKKWVKDPYKEWKHIHKPEPLEDEYTIDLRQE